MPQTMLTIPYARQQPVDNSDYIRMMSEMMLRRGDILAQARLARGANTAQAWQNVGNIAMSTFAGIGKQRDEERDRAMRQANLDREYAMKQQELDERANERRADLERWNRQFNEGRADKAANRIPVGTVLPDAEYERRGFPGTSAESAFEPQAFQAARLPATSMLDTAGIPNYATPATPSGLGPTDESAGPRQTRLMLPQDDTIDPDVSERVQGMKRIASQDELVQLENLRRQAETAAQLAADRRDDNQRAKDAAIALEKYRNKQLELGVRRAAAAERNAANGGTPQIIQGPNGWAIVNKDTGATKPVLGDDGRPMQRYGDTSALGPYQNAFDFAISKVTAAKRQPYINTAERLMSEAGADKSQILDFLKKTVLDNAGVDQQNQNIGREGAIAMLSRARGQLQELVREGVPTGWLEGGVENLVRRLGTTGNPKLVQLGTELGVSLSNYRRSMTGAAFGEAEAKEYAGLWPSYKNEIPVNMAQIDGLLGAFGTYDRVFWRRMLGPSADTIFGGGGGADAAPAPTNKPKVVIGADGKLQRQ